MSSSVIPQKIGDTIVLTIFQYRFYEPAHLLFSIATFESANIVWLYSAVPVVTSRDIFTLVLIRNPYAAACFKPEPINYLVSTSNFEIAQMKVRLLRPFADKELTNNILPVPPFVLSLLIRLAFDV